MSSTSMVNEPISGFLNLFIVTVIKAVPALLPMMLKSLSTVATSGSSLLNVN